MSITSSLWRLVVDETGIIRVVILFVRVVVVTSFATGNIVQKCRFFLQRFLALLLLFLMSIVCDDIKSGNAGSYW